MQALAGVRMTSKGGSTRAKEPAEESLVANTATLRNMFAKSAKLESYDILETTGAARRSANAHVAMARPGRKIGG